MMISFKDFFFCAVLLVTILKVDISNAITGPTHGKVVICYIGTWAVYRPERGSFKLEHIDPTLCTHVIYSFAGLNVTHDGIRSLDPWQDLTDNYGKGGYNRITKLKDRYPHLKVSLAIGGWNEGSVNYSRMVADPIRRSNFVVNTLEFIKKYNFDGLDLDWEFPAKRGGSPSDKLNFLLLVKELRASFNKFNLLLTAAFGAGKDTIDNAYDVENLSFYLDYIHMMCYDYHGAWDRKTGANAPLRSFDVLNVEFTIQYMIKLGADPSKLVMGVPLYGRTYILPDPVLSSTRTPRLGEIAQDVGFQGPFTRENGFMGYNEICLELKNTSAGWVRHWDDESRTPFLVNGERVITYDDEQSIMEKVKYAMEKKLAGAMVWSIDTDDFQGDCADDLNNQRFTNFPLMRTINKAIETSLEEIERNRENEISHGTADDKNNNGAVKISCHYITLSIIIGFIVSKF